MAMDTNPVRSRRVVLAAAAGTLAAVAADAVQPLVARAADGDQMQVGGTYTETTETRLENTAGGVAFTGIGGTGITGSTNNGGRGVRGEGATDGIGVEGVSANSAGVAGSSDTGIGVSAYSGGTAFPAAGVSGEGQRLGVWGHGIRDGATGVHGLAKNGVGVNGEDQSAGVGVFGSSMSIRPGEIGVGGIGVHGQDLADGVGVQGTSTTAGGRGVLAENTGGGIALDVCGMARINAGPLHVNAQSIFAGPADFGPAHFHGPADFNGGASFNDGPVQFGPGPGPVTFQELATFAVDTQFGGPAHFNAPVDFGPRAGIATIPSGSTSVTVTAPVGSSSLVLATLQTVIAGVYVTAAVPNVAVGTFTIYLSKGSKGAKVAWFVIG